MSYIDHDKFEEIQEEFRDAIDEISEKYELTNLEVRIAIAELDKFYTWQTLPNPAETCTQEEWEKNNVHR